MIWLFVKTSSTLIHFWTSLQSFKCGVTALLDLMLEICGILFRKGVGKKSLAIHYRLLKKLSYLNFFFFWVGVGGRGVKLRNPNIGVLKYSNASSMCINCPSLVSFFSYKIRFNHSLVQIWPCSSIIWGITSKPWNQNEVPLKKKIKGRRKRG